MDIKEAKQKVDKIIKKARVHLYKPIQIAEILHRDRVSKDIDLADLETYRNSSKKWRDVICQEFIGRISTSSAKYQDNLFEKNAIPPEILVILGKENRKTKGGVEAYIYRRFLERFSQLSNALDYTVLHDKSSFDLIEFIDSFREEAGLKRSIDKIYEIIVFALFSAVVDALEVNIEISYNPEKTPILKEFESFAKKVISLHPNIPNFNIPAKIFRGGITNASDRGLDMWANFGLAIQIKHLSLNEAMASKIVGSVTADRIVIVCKKAEKKVILSLLNQIGWKSRIQAIITEDELVKWYEKAMTGIYSNLLGTQVLDTITKEIEVEFPATKSKEFNAFYNSRNYSSSLQF